MTQTSHRLIAAAGWLTLVAVAGALVIDTLWWALVPATVLLAAGLLMRPTFATDGLARLGSLVLAVALIMSLAANAAGLATAERLGFEPAWVARLSVLAGTAIVVAAASLGIGIASRDRGSRSAGALLALALPVGIGVDWALDRLLLANIFLAGVGFYAGMLLFGIGLIRLGNQRTRASAEPGGAKVSKARRRPVRRPRRVTASTYL